MHHPTRFFALLLGCSLLFTGHSLIQASPSSRPSQQRKAQKGTPPTTRPHKTHTIKLQIDKIGRLHQQTKSMSLFELVQALEQWKTTKSILQLSIDPDAPYKKVSVLETLLKSSGLPFQKRFQAFKQSTPPPTHPIRRVPTKQPHSTITWNHVPLRTQRGIKHGGIELRGQLLDHKKQPTSIVPTALLLEKNGKQIPQARTNTNTSGQFRYKLKPRKNQKFMIAVFYRRRFLQFPIPLQSQKNGLLFLRLPLPNIPTPKRGTPHPTRRAHPTPRPHPHIFRRTPPTKTGPLLWSSAPSIKTPEATTQQNLVLRIRVSRKGGISESYPTGLIRRIGKKRLPMGRAKTNKNGLIRYIIKPTPGATYELAVLFGTKLHMHTVPPIKTNKKTLDVNVVLPMRKFVPILFEGVHVLLEPLPKKPDSIRLTHFISLLYQRPSNGQPAPKILLPTLPTQTQIQVGQNLKKMKIKREFAGIRINSKLKIGRNRFSYAYVIPAPKGQLDFQLSIPYPAERTALFFHPSLKPIQRLKELTKTQLSQGANGPKRDFFVLRLGKTNAKKDIKLKIVNSKFEEHKGLKGWIKKMRETPNSRKQLYGIGALLATTIFGLLFLILSPSPTPNNTKPDKEEETKEEETKEEEAKEEETKEEEAEEEEAKTTKKATKKKSKTSKS